MGIQHHDAYRALSAANVAYAASGGTSTQSAAFGSQTYWIRICAVGLASAGLTGVRYQVSESVALSAL